MDWRYRASVVLGVVGLVDALYLTWLKVSGNEALCLGFGECDVVNSSPYAEIYGIPIALVGAMAYAVILGLLVWEVRSRAPHHGLWARYGVFMLTLAGTLYSAYLTYIEVAVLEAICPFCVISAVVLVLLWVLALLRLLHEDSSAIPA